ncbi:MAG: serine hydrolase [Sphingomicrobium sp.]
MLRNLCWCIAVAAASSSVSVEAAERCSAELSNRVYPGKEWVRAPAGASGWSEAGLETAWARAAASFSAGVLVHHGRMIGSFGDIAKPMETRSMRKAFLSVVIGQLVGARTLRLDATLAEMGVDDVTPLTAVEKSATLKDLLDSRSGIYLPAAYVVPGDADDVPPRGTHRPGEAFYYWNWGFNALGGIVEQVTGKSVFESIETSLTRPVGFQDFVRSRDTRYVREPVSRYPAYLIDLSARDRARVGLMYLNEGCWKGRQIVSRNWVRDSVSPITNQTKDFDYGYLWWSTEPPEGSGLTQRIFMARGFANQYIIGLPELDAVFVLSVDMAGGKAAGLKPPRRSDFQAVFDQVLKSRPGQN